MGFPFATPRDFYDFLKAEAITNSARAVVSVDPATNRFLLPGHGMQAGDVGRFELGGASHGGGSPALPAPLSAFELYHVLPAGGDLFAVSATAGGSAIDVTTAGTGLLSFVLDMEASVLRHLARAADRVLRCLGANNIDVSLLTGDYPWIASLVIRLAVWPVLLARGYTTGRQSDPDQDYKALWQAAEEELSDICAGKGKLPPGLPEVTLTSGLSASYDDNLRGWTPNTPEMGI
jgi:hypothetical protein